MPPSNGNPDPPADWRSRHLSQLIVLRWALAPWILFVTVFLCAKGYWWGLIFLPFVGLDLWLLRRLIRERDARGRGA
jgi:membrane protein implicated in regulation of membrane protease activity